MRHITINDSTSDIKNGVNVSTFARQCYEMHALRLTCHSSVSEDFKDLGYSHYNCYTYYICSRPL